MQERYLQCLKYLSHFVFVQRQNPEELVGKEIPLKFLEVDEERTRLVLSNRKALAENQSMFGIGSVVVGTVQTVKPYGAFIDIGGVSGLLHISQISHDRLTTVETVLSPGDKLKVLHFNIFAGLTVTLRNFAVVGMFR